MACDVLRLPRPAAVTFLGFLHLTWRWAFIILGAISLIITVVISVFLRDDPRLHPSVTREELGLARS